MSKEELQKLAEKISTGTATKEEILLYNRICSLLEATGDPLQELPQAARESLEASLRTRIFFQTRIQKTTGRYWMRRTVAAAAVLVLLAIGGYFFFYCPPQHRASVAAAPLSRFKNDVLPGRDGAILTLANGQTIVLDSAANGELVKQGGAHVIKNGEQLLYSASGNRGEVGYNTMTTPRGRQFQLTLSDGTAVWLNAASSITYPTVFAGKERKVAITGEVYFEVAPNKALPFEVQKDGVTVQVLGTHFNMNTYDDEASLKVTLLEGAVRVTAAASTGLLAPGQQAQVKNNAIQVSNDVNVDEVIAWKNGFFQFRGAGIDALMRQLSRWYDVEVEYNKKVTDRFYADIPRNTRLSDALKALELTGAVQFGIEGKKIVVMP